MKVDQPEIIAYLNPYCGWTRGVTRLLDKHELEFEYRDISRDAALFEEMVRKTGQYSSPCVQIDGHMLADVGASEVEEYMQKQGLLEVLPETE